MLGISYLVGDMTMWFQVSHKDKRRITYKRKRYRFQCNALCQYGFFYQFYFRNHPDSSLYGRVVDDAIWKFHWRRLAAQLVSWDATPSGAVGRRFTAILAAEWQRVLGRSWNSERPLVFVHVVLTNTLGVLRAKENIDRISKRMDLWERGLHAGLVGVAKAEGASREIRDASGEKDKDKAEASSYHNIVLYGKLGQAVRWATYKEGGGCLLLDDQFTNNGRPVAEVLQ